MNRPEQVLKLLTKPTPFFIMSDSSSSKSAFIKRMKHIISELMHYKSKDFILVLDDGKVHFLNKKLCEEFMYSNLDTMKTKHYDPEMNGWWKLKGLVHPEDIMKIGYTPKHNEKIREFIDFN